MSSFSGQARTVMTVNDHAEKVSRLAESWDDAAEGYDEYFVPRFAPWVEAAVEAVTPDEIPSGPVLVPCCGTFPEADVILKRLPGREVLGIDLSAEMVRFARQRARGRNQISVRQGDAANSDGRLEGTYSAVVSVFGLQQLPDPSQALLSWSKALCPGGLLSVVYWPAVTERDGPFTWLSELRGFEAPESPPWEDELANHLADRGMTVLRDQTIAFPMSHPSAAAFFDAFTYSGPMRTLVNARGDEYIRELREAYLAYAPSGAIEHQPAARHIVVRVTAR